MSDLNEAKEYIRGYKREVDAARKGDHYYHHRGLLGVVHQLSDYAAQVVEENELLNKRIAALEAALMTPQVVIDNQSASDLDMIDEVFAIEATLPQTYPDWRDDWTDFRTNRDTFFSIDVNEEDDDDNIVIQSNYDDWTPGGLQMIKFISRIRSFVPAVRRELKRRSDLIDKLNGTNING